VAAGVVWGEGVGPTRGEEVANCLEVPFQVGEASMTQVGEGGVRQGNHALGVGALEVSDLGEEALGALGGSPEGQEVEVASHLEEELGEGACILPSSPGVEVRE